MLVLVPLDMSKNEIRNALIHVLAADPSSPTEGQIYYNNVNHTFRFYNGSVWVSLGTLNQVSFPVAPVDMGGQQITNMAAPTTPQSAVTKAYVDSFSFGLSWKDAARVATTSAGTLASSFSNGSTIDGVVLSTGDRILIKNQAAPAENGIYTVSSSGVPVRASDSDSGNYMEQATIMVQEGTSNADTLWTCTANRPIILGTTPLPFVQVGSGVAYSAGAGLTLTGNVLAVGAGTGLTVNADDVALTVPIIVANGGTGVTTLPAKAILIGAGALGVVSAVAAVPGQVVIADASLNPTFGSVTLDNSATVNGTLPITNGGTGATTAAAARAALGTVGKFVANVGNGSSLFFQLTHGFNTNDVVVQVVRASDWVMVTCDVTMNSPDTVVVTFAVAPTTNQYRVTVIG
jgi:hypothetical protein